MAKRESGAPPRRQGEARPTRARVLDALAQHADGLTVCELHALVGGSESSVRRELAALTAGGRVHAVIDRSGRPGRPSTRFRVAGGPSSWLGVVRVFVEDLGRSGAVGEDLLRRLGRQAATEGLPDGAGLEEVTDAQSRLGFAPFVRTAAHGDGIHRDVEFRFGNCPLEDAVTAQGGEALCRLHLGMLEGAAAAAGGQVTAFVAREPRLRRCEAHLRLRAAPNA